jgi:uncharacterized repeat protein (TIGR01451 family)
MIRRVGSILFVFCSFGLLSAAASAEAPAPWWGLTSGSRPTNLIAGERGEIIVTAENRGDAPTSGNVTLTDTLPEGLKALAVKAVAGGVALRGRAPVSCPAAKQLKEGAALACTFGQFENESKELLPEALPPYEEIELVISVEVLPSATSAELNTATVSGGGASLVSASHAIEVNGTEHFGVEDFQVIPENAGGHPDTQAGSHPFQLTILTTLNTKTPDAQGQPRTVALPKDLIGTAPAGLVGNPTPFAQCTDAQFAIVVHLENLGGAPAINECPVGSAVGVATVTFNLKGLQTATAPIFNMVPRRGEPARFAFKVEGLVPVFLDTSVLTGTNYAVTLGSSNIVQLQWLTSVKLALWGVPGSKAHDAQRGWLCLLRDPGACPSTTETAPPPFLIMPTSCDAPFTNTLESDSWASAEHPTEQGELAISTLPEKLDGCNQLPFAPQVGVSPDVPDASTATGLTVDVHVPQAAALNGEGLAESALRDTTVALPEGVALNAADADGLQACSESEIGFTGSNPQTGTEEFTPEEPACPDASKVATVKIKTPLLPNPLEGAVYLASPQNFAGPPQANPFSSLIALYLVAKDPVSGVLVKLPGEVKPNPVTGQLVSTFLNTPELPFEDLELHFFGGERAPLATPPHCGSYTTSASFTPWSGNESVNPSSSFQVTTGPNGSACPGASLPFAPSLAAGSPNINAGSFSALDTTLGRQDGQQNLSSVQLHMAPGMSGILAGVKLCPEAQANAGTCDAESEIGETIVSVGVGGDPFTVTGGKVYLTEKYQGAPFGLSIVNPAKAGPFNLQEGRPVVVRARIEVDPATAALTITTGAIPRIIDGFPLQIKHVNVNVNRPGFTFNPTNCNRMSITGSINGAEGASSPVSVPFQVTNCASLKFTPTFTVSTSAKPSKANGASLTTKLAEPAGALGTQANITKVKVELPKQLPSRLTTLQKACTNAQFESNPAGCPMGSFIGHATVHTPLLPVPLTGPAIFVSHGGEAFPSLVIVLQGYGVTVDLVGTTFIDKAGITSTTFKTVPDTPFNTFELTLPQGKFSALASNLPAKANGSFCGQKLVMPSEFIAQNGALLRQSNPVSVTGCPKKKTLTRAQKLSRALKACKKKAKGKRAACAQQAHRKFGPAKKRKKK